MTSSEKDARLLSEQLQDQQCGEAILIGNLEKPVIESLSLDDANCISILCDINQPGISQATTIAKRAFLQKLGYMGEVVRSGDAVYLSCIDKILIVDRFLAVKVAGSFQSFVQGRNCHYVMECGEVQYHVSSNFPCVHAPTDIFTTFASNISRKVMLYPEDDATYVAIDYDRPYKLSHEIIVPVHPEVGDMVKILGESDAGHIEHWYGHVLSVNWRLKQVSLLMYIKSTRWPDRNIFLPEKKAGHLCRETVNLKSLICIASGVWKSDTCWQLQ